MKKKTIFTSIIIAAAFLFATSAYAIQGDLDGSGLVDGLDLAIMSTSFGLDSASPNWEQEADIAGSGLVDGVDLSSLAPNFGMKDGLGSVVANIVWGDEPANKPMFKSIASASKPLAKVANIDTVFINISAADISPPMSQSFPYSSGEGAISGVPAGIRVLTVTGSYGGNPVYKGTATITVRAGSTTTVPIYATAIDLLTVPVAPKLAAGFGHSLALKDDGTIWAWGLNDVGQFGDSTQADSSVPVDTNRRDTNHAATNQTGYIAIDSESDHAVAIRFDGTVWTWGANDCGQLGNDEFGVCQATTITEFENYPVYVRDMSGDYFDNVTAVAAGASHTAALKNDGTVWAWGGNFFGQLGDNTKIDKSVPVQVRDQFGNISTVSSISAGGGHTLALKSDGSVWAWGYNASGQIGDNTLLDKEVATKVLGEGGFNNLTGIIAITAGARHSVALKNDGTVWTWGDKDWGQLGDATFGNQSSDTIFGDYTTTPVQVVDTTGTATLTDIKSIAAGDYFTLALATDGTLYSWGRNDFGQLGDGTTDDRASPFVVTGYAGTVEEIFTGDEHALVITTGGDVWAWGRNSYAQLGTASLLDLCPKVTPEGTIDYDCSMTPVQVAPEFNLLN